MAPAVFLQRLRSTLTTPGWHRAVLLRRCAAVLFLLAAGVHALRGANPDLVQAVVTTRSLAAGEELSQGDVELRGVQPEQLPEGALVGTDGLEQAGGGIVVAAAGRGRMLANTDLVSDATARELAGDYATLVPIRLADPDLAALLRHGDELSVLAGGTDGAAATPLALGARVVVASPDAHNAIVLLAMPEEAAAAVASATLAGPLAVVITGTRARGADTPPDSGKSLVGDSDAAFLP